MEVVGEASPVGPAEWRIGDRVAPGVAWVRPVLPPVLPRGWRTEPSDDALLLWQRAIGRRV